MTSITFVFEGWHGGVVDSIVALHFQGPGLTVCVKVLSFLPMSKNMHVGELFMLNWP